MLETVTLPVWLVGLIALLATVALVDRAIRPLARAILRARAERAVAALNTTLRLPIAPFQLARRGVLIERIIHDPDVESAIAREAADKGTSPDAEAARARAYAREIVPSFNAYLYFRIGTRLARKVCESLYRVRVGAIDADKLATIPPNASVVFVINHRSNLDYILLTYTVAGQSALSYAVGEWARIPGLATLIRMMGAYFIRRDSTDPLYRRVLACYVRLATTAGVVQAVFPEGGLSRDGALRPAKLGLLSYMVAGFDPNGARDVVFVPVGLNYDRVLEDRILVAASATPDGAKPRFAVSPGRVLAFLAGHLWRRITGRNWRYGYACVTFGAPVSLRRYIATEGTGLHAPGEADRFAAVERLGARLMTEVAAAVPALPVSLVATTLLDVPPEARGLTAFEIKARVALLIDALEAGGTYVHIPRADRDYAIETGLRLLTLRRLVLDDGGLYRIAPNERVILAYYANAIRHHVAHARTAAPVRLFPTSTGIADAGVHQSIQGMEQT